jgi:hypothetical protein
MGNPTAVDERIQAALGACVLQRRHFDTLRITKYDVASDRCLTLYCRTLLMVSALDDDGSSRSRRLIFSDEIGAWTGIWHCSASSYQH